MSNKIWEQYISLKEWDFKIKMPPISISYGNFLDLYKFCKANNLKKEFIFLIEKKKIDLYFLILYFDWAEYLLKKSLFRNAFEIDKHYNELIIDIIFFYDSTKNKEIKNKILEVEEDINSLKLKSNINVSILNKIAENIKFTKEELHNKQMSFNEKYKKVNPLNIAIDIIDGNSVSKSGYSDNLEVEHSTIWQYSADKKELDEYKFIQELIIKAQNLKEFRNFLLHKNSFFLFLKNKVPLYLKENSIEIRDEIKSDKSIIIYMEHISSNEGHNILLKVWNKFESYIKKEGNHFDINEIL